MTEPSMPAPMFRDVAHWSARPRMWRFTAERRDDGYEAVSSGARLPELEALAAKNASRFTSEATMTFFRLPDRLKEEAASVDPASLLRPEGGGESRRFIEHFAEYLEFLGLSSELSARACAVAPLEVSRAIVPPFAEPPADGGDTLVCCNLSEVPARLALAAGPPPAAGEAGEANSIALSLELGDCLIGVRRSILGYIPDEQGEPTFWFECLLRNTRSSARLP
jgi:hypothetical protein